MKTVLLNVIALGLCVTTWATQDRKAPPAPPRAEAAVREVRYDGQLTDTDARFGVELDIEVTGKGAATVPLFDGELVVTTTKLPDHLRLSRAGNLYALTFTKEGRQKVKLDLIAKIQRAEPWNSVSFTGPVAVIGSVQAQAAGAGVEVQLLKGTVLETGATGGVTRVRGFLGPERVVALRWQSKAAEVTRKALLTCDTAASVAITPTVVKYTTHLKYDIVQGQITRLLVNLPANQALTKLAGDNVRDWAVKTVDSRTGILPVPSDAKAAAETGKMPVLPAQQILTVEFVRPVEKNYALTLLSEQTVESAAATVSVAPPQPLDVEREVGGLTVGAEDVLVEIESAAGLRQVNAVAGALAAYQFHARPFALGLKLRRIEPVVSAADRATVRLEESRLVVNHALTLNVEKAGIYTLELGPQAGFVVADVQGEGVEDWKAKDGKLTLTFGSRVLGRRQVMVQLEQAQKNVAEKIEVAPLRVTGAVKETAAVGAAAVAGIQLKTVAEGLTGLREMPIDQLPERVDEVLAYHAEQASWKLTLAAERLAARLVADVFNLITVGDGIVGGSARFRFVILNQGVQEFRVKLPAHWRNLEFTGPNIRRKEQSGDTWLITLQDKAWGAYPLVVTYDFQFDPHRAALPVGGAHAVGVERETGSIAITSATNLQIAEGKAAEAPLRRVDETELAEGDRSVITRPVLLAYRYTGDAYELTVEINRFQELPILEAVADRTQLTTVLTEHGQLLTQASFMVKNNDKQFQSFTLPAGADFWSCYVRGEPAKPERTGNTLLVPLPRRANRDEAFPVDIVYAQTIGAIKGWTPRTVALAAPVTDVQTTYAEWELYVPRTHRLANFTGNMIIAQSAVGGLRAAWRQFKAFYSAFFSQAELVFFGGLTFLFLAAATVVLIRRRWGIGLGLLGAAVLGGLWTIRLVLAPLNVVATMGMADPTRIPPLTQYFMERHAAEPPAMRADFEAPDGTAAKPADVSGFGTTAGAAVIVPGGGTVMPVVAGIRPIRIEIPKTGNRFVFNKVLNVRGEPLAVGAWALEDNLYKAVRGLAQAVVFVLGLVLLAWQWRKGKRGAFATALGIALALGGLGSFLLSARLLDDALIWGAPIVAFVLVVWLLRVIWKRIPPKNRGPGTGNREPIPPLVTAVALLALASATAQAAPTNAVQVISANYTGTVRESTGADRQPTAQLEAVFELKSDAPNQTIRLFGPEAAVQEFSGPTGRSTGWFGRTKTTDARLVRTDGTVSVLLPDKGPASVRVRFLVKLAGDAVKRRLELGIPPALMTKLALALEEPDVTVEAPTAVSFKTATDAGKTRVEAVLGAADKVELTWTPRTKRAADIAATVFCQNTALVALGGGVLNARAALDYAVTQGELRQMKVRLPAGHRLMRVEGENIRTWKLDGETVNVELVKGVSPNYRLTVETEQPLAEAGKATVIQVPHALDVKRETGLLALKAADELSVTVETAAELQKVDVEEFGRAWSASKPLPGVGSAYRFLKPEFTFATRVEPVQPEIEASVRYAAGVSAEQIRLTTTVEYTIKRAGVFALRLALPAGYRVEKVTGANIAQWVEKGAENTLEVTLKQRTLGNYSLRVDLARPLRELPPNVEIVGPQPLGAQKLTGFVSVAAEEGVQVKTANFTGITEVPAATLGVSGGALAFKLIPADAPAMAPNWKLAVATEKIESWVRAEVVHGVALNETLVSGRSVVRYEIQNAPTKEFRLRAPAGLRNVEVTGANIRRKDRQENEWRIELQNKVRGNYTLTVTWDQPWNVKDGTLKLAGVEALGVEREIGWIAVNAPAQFRVEAPRAGADLLKCSDARELPAWAGRGDAMPALAYRYLRPGFALALAVQRFDEAEVLQALVDNVQLTTVISEDGQMMTEMKLAIRNNARQYLEVALPPGTTNVWSAFVAGQPVRPSVRAGKLLLPMERSGSDGAPVSVELTYISASKFPQGRGGVGLVAPAVDVPLKNARWDLYLPPEYAYGGFAGTMEREKTVAEVTATRSVAQTLYTWGDYAEMEGKNKLARDVDQKKSVSQARSNISAGNVNDAYQYYNRAKQNADLDDAVANEDLRRLEKEVRREQGRRILQEQRQYAADNTGTGQPQAQAVNQPAQIAVNYDEVMAVEQQAEKMQKAQEIVVAKALPLRVNLPVRGQRLGFTQTLQTKPGEAMTVEFTATASKAFEAPVGFGAGLVGFLALWFVVALVYRRRAA